MTACALPMTAAALAALINCSPAIVAEPMQTPRPPYRVTALTVTVGTASVAGHLSLPEGPVPVPVVIVVGTGRDADVAIADQLPRRRVAVLQAELAGVDPVQLAVAAAAATARVANLDQTRIGFLAFSDGWALAAAATDQAPSVAALVLLAHESNARPLRAALLMRGRSGVTIVPSAPGREGTTDAVFFDELAAWLRALPGRQ